ncbi:TrkH family potassium uptake protein [Thermosulfuriphilus sp.]
MDVYLISKRLRNHPAALVLLGFGLVDLLGTVLLYFPPMHQRPLSLIDALFTATSALCVTGLTVTNTAETFTSLGKSVILILMQVGGLGVMTFSVLLAYTLGRPVRLSDRVVVQESFLHRRVPDLRYLIGVILIFTMIVESVAAVGLGLFFLRDFPAGKAFAHGIFHAVSAFCNAGFSSLPQGLIPYRDDWAISGIVMVTILLGNTGFAVIYELVDRLLRPRSGPFSVHFRLTVGTHFFLIILGGLGLLYFERSGLLGQLPESSKILVAAFHSISARTAGFNTVDIAGLTEDSLYLLLLLMFIGACPGSTGGGLKTTTVAVLWFTALSRLRGFPRTVIFRRSIPESTVQRALTLFVIMVVVALGAHLILMIIGPNLPFSESRSQFLAYLFETISALGTVGLSVGLTPHLGTSGKILIIMVMFIGRVGLLSVLSVLARVTTRPRPYYYAEENLMVG